jgi:hypothetical protein
MVASFQHQPRFDAEHRRFTASPPTRPPATARVHFSNAAVGSWLSNAPPDQGLTVRLFIFAVHPHVEIEYGGERACSSRAATTAAIACCPPFFDGAQQAVADHFLC